MASATAVLAALALPAHAVIKQAHQLSCLMWDWEWINNVISDK
jgi:hypothetical protein